MKKSLLFLLFIFIILGAYISVFPPEASADRPGVGSGLGLGDGSIIPGPGVNRAPKGGAAPVPYPDTEQTKGKTGRKRIKTKKGSQDVLDMKKGKKKKGK